MKYFIASIIVLLSFLALGVQHSTQAQTVSSDYFATDDSATDAVTINSLQYVAGYHCRIVDCDDIAVGEPSVAEDPEQGKTLAQRLSATVSATTQKREQLAKARDDLIAIREYRKARDEAASSIPTAPCGTGKCIYVSISRQKFWAYENGEVAISSLLSSGTASHPTPVGQYAVYAKTRSQRMRGPGYDLPNVPYILWWHGDYSFHGTYWHHNFGHRMSHGCLNLPTPVAEQLFNWAPVGTPVTVVR